ncbi:phenylalanine--tRNA ligase subunit beta [Spiroplasma turonicum]|uniref:Phenylalanine--tRNA ligase beta subunit n=1 Tax=Spiroplasma turonicum TaxID=216946 RepID=A0A0K1P586_9MOLU|nr:phenylalanine--tRNA ligase subunit beta [Spiroplasma turonicum]AKU79476.1 phenylalanyl-tRNA synthetase subunit beta [Spiroplasma turonicum]ALX70497.1 phenylalanyl-tRNA synthetase subunit beta [Spiroplasma turonicum]
MYITRRWISKFIDLVGVKDEEITTALNSLGFEVESYKNYSDLNDRLKIVHVGNVAPIEGTSLNFCFIDSGEDLVIPVVCGAHNIKEGDYVIWAEPGKTISTGQTLTKKEIKGKVSEGMICSLEEIGLDKNVQNEEELEGIYQIITKEETYKSIGSETALERIGFLDSVWEFDLTLNRSDALAAFQVLKEIANYFDKEIVDYFKGFEIKVDNSFKKIEFKIDKGLEKVIKSLTYSIINLKDIITVDKFTNQIYSTDDMWLKFNGIKKTNNFFDRISQIIALETGQPVIILDADKIDKIEFVKVKIDDKEIIQINSNNEEVSKIGKNIVEDYKPNDKTKSLLVIIGWFDTIFMRNQQKAFNLNNVEFQRYTKPLSPNLCMDALKRLIFMLDRYKIYNSTSGPIEIIKYDTKPNIIKVPLNFINNLLGVNLTIKDIKDLFRTLDFKINVEEDVLVFEVDPKRTYISNKADICEEVARLYGYDKIKPIAPNIISSPSKKDLNNRIKNQVESFLYGQGFNNIKTYSLISSDMNDKWNLFKINDPIKLLSPLSKFKDTFRTNLSWSIIDVASFNASRGNKDLKIYEYADIYNLKNIREQRLSILISGNQYKDKFHNFIAKSSFYYLKGIVQQVFKSYNLNTNKIEYVELDNLITEMHPYISFKVIYNNELLGFLYKLNPRYEQSLKLEPTFVCELNITKLEELKESKVVIKEISKFQSSSRDITFILNNTIKYLDIIKKVINDIKYLTKLSLVDVYEDENLIKNNQRSITINLKFNSNEKQLKEDDINSSFNSVLNNLKKENIEVK